jgi:hypothetical protein
MTDMAELKTRKEPLNLGVVHVDPDLFSNNFVPWLEITAFIGAQRKGLAAPPQDGRTPVLSAVQLASADVARVGDDAISAFCMTAALKGDKAAVDAVEAALIAQLGDSFPGSAALRRFREPIDTPTTLDEIVGQAGRKLLLGDKPPPPLRAKENWSTALRFLEKARGSNFIHEIMYPLARWTRACGVEIQEKGVAFLTHIEDSVPILREVLADPRNDQSFVANYLGRMAPAVDMELNEEYEGLLRSIARRG